MTSYVKAVHAGFSSVNYHAVAGVFTDNAEDMTCLAEERQLQAY